MIEIGLLGDFGLVVDGVDDPTLDDAIYINVRDSKGVIAGSNPRSVLFAVYRFLEASGCQWIRPGPDGDYVPLRRVHNLSVQLTDKATYRFRGHKNSDAYNLDYIISKIEWSAKVGLNTYYNEFLIPKKFFQSWYNREYPTQKEPAPRTDTEIIAYYELLNREVKRRGMLLHAAGHGWNSLFFGNPLVESDHWGNMEVPEDQIEYLSMVDGERKWHSRPTYDELCYGNPRVRERMVHLVADYAENNPVIERNMLIEDPVYQMSWKLLSVHSEMVILMADVFVARIDGREADEKEAWAALSEYIVENEDITKGVFDVFSFQRIFRDLP